MSLCLVYKSCLALPYYALPCLLSYPFVSSYLVSPIASGIDYYQVSHHNQSFYIQVPRILAPIFFFDFNLTS